MGTLTVGPAPHQRYPARGEADAGAARRAAGQLADAAGVARGAAETIAAELATNIWRHAGGNGYLLCQAGEGFLEIVACDHGPGLPAGAAAPRRSPGNGQGPGTGLDLVRRLASWSGCWTGPAGTVLAARLGNPRRSLDHVARWGAVNVPRGGTGESGDNWLVTTANARLAALVVDGLGHGPQAATAARAAVDALARWPVTDPELSLARAHEAMRATRGGVLGVAVIDPAAGNLVYAGAGNISGWVLARGRRHGLLSREGTVGTQEHPPRPYVTRVPWSTGATLILASDGLRTLRGLESSPGLWRLDPTLAAAVLYRDFGRDSDDACVLVLRDTRQDPS